MSFSEKIIALTRDAEGALAPVFAGFDDWNDHRIFSLSEKRHGLYVESFTDSLLCWLSFECVCTIVGIDSSDQFLVPVLYCHNYDQPEWILLCSDLYWNWMPVGKDQTFIGTVFTDCLDHQLCTAGHGSDIVYYIGHDA